MFWRDNRKLSLPPRRGNLDVPYGNQRRFYVVLLANSVSCGTNASTISYLNRRVRRGALAVPVQCNLCEERDDLADYPIYARSRVASAGCGTLRKATQQKGRLAQLGAIWHPYRARSNAPTFMVRSQVAILNDAELRYDRPPTADPGSPAPRPGLGRRRSGLLHDQLHEPAP